MNRVETKRIKKFLGLLSKIIVNRSAMPILKCVLLAPSENGTCILTANNLTVSAEIDTGWPWPKDCQLAIEFSALRTVLKNSRAVIEIDIKEKGLLVKNHHGTAWLDSEIDPEEMPLNPSTTFPVIMTGHFQMDYLSKFCSNDDARAALNDDAQAALTGVYLEPSKQRIFAADGFRLAIKSWNSFETDYPALLAPKVCFIIPRKTVELLPVNREVEFAIINDSHSTDIGPRSHGFIRMKPEEGLTLTSLLIRSDIYLDIDVALPKFVDRAEITLKRSAISAFRYATDLCLENGSTTIIVNIPDVGFILGDVKQREMGNHPDYPLMGCIAPGFTLPQEVAINPKYMADAILFLRSAEGGKEKFQVSISEAYKDYDPHYTSVHILGDTCQALIMPMFSKLAIEATKNVKAYLLNWLGGETVAIPEE